MTSLEVLERHINDGHNWKIQGAWDFSDDSLAGEERSEALYRTHSEIHDQEDLAVKHPSMKGFWQV